MVRADSYLIAIEKTILDIHADEHNRTCLVKEAHLRGQAAFAAGIRNAAEIALFAARRMELRPDADQVRQRAAIEALRGLAEGLKAGLLKEGEPCTDPAKAGGIPEPEAIVSAYDQDVLG